MTTVGNQFAPMSVSTLKENIAGVLSGAIFSGKLKPGERLNESQLSRDLHVSRAPIREALQHLQEQGLVMNSPRRGMFVVLLEDDDIVKINSVRLILEAEAMCQARTKMTPADEIRLIELLERLEGAQLESPAIRARYDLDFHQAIWSLTGNPYLERTLHGLTAPLFAHAVLRTLHSETVRHIIDSHRPLMDFLQRRSDVPPHQLVAEHLRITWVRPER